jgi:hypothetical protein
MNKPSVPRKIVKLSEPIHQQLNMYAIAAGAAGVGALALVPPSEARIVYTPAHVTLQNTKPFALDLNHDGNIDFYLVQHRQFLGRTHSASNLSVCHELSTALPYCAFSRSSTAPNALNAVATVIATSTIEAAALRAGAEIQRGRRFRNKKPVLMGAGEFYQTTQGRMSTQWIAPWVNGGKGIKNHYLGLKFKIKGKFHFGWARLSVTTRQNSLTATLTGYAYETIPGQGIIAGQTNGTDEIDNSVEQSKANDPGHGASLTSPTPDAPQPASLGMLALGVQGVQLWRRTETQEGQ